MNRRRATIAGAVDTLRQARRPQDQSSALLSAVGRQFCRPSGVLGRLAGRAMAKRNGAVNAWAVALLEIGPHDRVLDVGCGPGLALALSAERATEGFVAGVDHSDVMVRHARRRNRAAIEAGRVEVRLGSASELPYSDRHFTKACAVNSLQFWTSAEEGLRELWRVLAPGGRLLVVMRMRCEGAGRFDRSRYGVTDSRLAEVLTALGATEFSDVTAERGDVGGETYTAVLARRPRRPSAP